VSRRYVDPASLLSDEERQARALRVAERSARQSAADHARRDEKRARGQTRGTKPDMYLKRRPRRPGG
jgi:hypothetical protein